MVFYIITLMSILCISEYVYANEKSLKVLHISFHQGCINDIKEVGHELGLDLTSWYILSRDKPRTHFDGITRTNAIYNISCERAQRVWEKHKDYFDTFDVIMTSDTAPLSRIFLQNNWKKPLIIWVCNRFDYYDFETRDYSFPDCAYYDLFTNAAYQDNVKIISYTPYEYVYAESKGVLIGRHMIRPVGSLPRNMPDFKSAIPESVCKDETLFIFPRMDKNQIAYVSAKCAEQGIKTYSGYYNGPEDLVDFRGVIFFPYAWSNLSLFENIQRGIVHFVPTERFVLEYVRNKEPIRYFALSDLYLCDWYCDEFRDLFVYFDSWNDLKEKIQSTDFANLSQKIKQAGCVHRTKTLKQWQRAFQECREYLNII